ncbi:MAG TPA: DUF2207 domain-containing protein, partial [Candidatus Pacearchaeota archaeon]|nr:DUF2207 domain-containing protein [Candidatus Pacearchaeota archaeon]
MEKRVLMLFFVFLILASFSVSAKDYYWEEISTNVYLKSDGTAQVSEIQKFNFSGEFTYAFRYFHFDEIKGVRNFKVYDENGAEYNAIEYSEGKYKVFKWFYTAKDEERIFILNYTLVGPVKQGLFQDKVFWTGVFKDHEKRVEKATINFNFYDVNKNQEKIKYQIYPEADSYFQDSALIATTKTSLSPYIPFELIITAPAGVLAPEKIYFFCFKIILLVLIFSWVVSIFLRYKKEHELFGKELKIPAFEKGEIRYVNLRPAIVGLLMSGKVQRKEILATITDLARRGYIHINVVKRFFSQDFELLRLKNNRDELLEYEKMTLTMLFKNKDKILMSELKIRPTIQGEIEKIIEEIYAEAKKQNLYEENPETVKKSYQRRALIYIIFPLVVLFFNIFYSPNKNGNVIWGYLFFFAIVFIVLILKRTGSQSNPNKKDFSIENPSKKYFKESSKKDLLKYIYLISLIIIFGLISKENFISLLNIAFGAGFVSGGIILV